MKARQCADCEHFEFKWPYEEAECFMGHKPRFYQPRNPNDDDWGWKRRCEDFAPKSDVSATNAPESRLPSEG